MLLITAAPHSGLAPPGPTLALEPSAAVHYNRALELHNRGRLEEAVSSYEQALVLDPHSAAAHNNLGVALHEAGRLDEAIVHYRHAVAIDPCVPAVHSNLGVALKARGQLVDALAHHQRALRLQPAEAIYRATFAECVSDLAIAQPSDALREDLVSTLSEGGVDYQDLWLPGISVVKSSNVFRGFLRALAGTGGTGSFEELMQLGLEDLCRDPLFLLLLRRAIIRDPLMEQILTIVRRACLSFALAGCPPDEPPAAAMSFTCALAQQCFLNEYLYSVSSAEERALEHLAESLRRRCKGGEAKDTLDLAAYASYRPLSSLRQNERLLLLAATEPAWELAELVRQQILAPGEESALKEGITALGSIEDAVSRRVRAQYEESPYPRWSGACRRTREPIPRALRRLFPHLDPRSLPGSDCPDILIAGCGTGRDAIERSWQFEGANILAVDVSLASLAYAKRKALELERPNLEFLQADILNLGELERRFDLIECIGVLHHMRDPAAGWRTLAGLLKPNGVMRLGLYSAIGREGIARAQSFVAARGYPATPEGIRACRQAIFSMPPEDGIRFVAKIFDFYTLSETRDLLFHVQEKRLKLPEISRIVDELGLRFLGFELPDSATKEGYVARFPSDPHGTSLRTWHEYERQNRRTFLGLYLFWLQATTPGG